MTIEDKIFDAVNELIQERDELRDMLLSTTSDEMKSALDLLVRFEYSATTFNTARVPYNCYYCGSPNAGEHDGDCLLVEVRHFLRAHGRL
jgi:hypothetical protein